MRAVVQRVGSGSVSADGEVLGRIGPGLVVLLGVGQGDGPDDARYLADKIINLRIFPDAAGRFQRSLLDVGGELLVVSQFTLYGDCRQGRRPSFTQAAPPDEGERLYRFFLDCLRVYPIRVATGRFGAHMLVEIANDGPVTILLDSKKLF